MNAMMNIQVNVLARQALTQMRQVQAELAKIRTAQIKSNGATSGFVNGIGNATRRIEKFGKNLQWSGRQLEYNFTLPLIIAGGMATKWALQNEKAMTRVSKVYGDLGEDVSAELKEIEKSFDLLSQTFGVHYDEVANIGAAWAQAGAAGVALQKATRMTLQTMIIGEMEATEATQKLIAVQSAYRLNTEELSAALATLNIIENQTAISFDGLIDVITRAGGAAATAGIGLRDLASLAAALVPQSGSASQAGNSLRTMISRLLAPTKQAADLLQELGLEIDSAGWQSKTGTERLMALAESFDGLTQSQKAVVSSTVASRWQINRFDVLMRDLKLSMDEATEAQSAYHRAQIASEDPQRNAQVMAKELSIALSTNERAFAILTNGIKNAMAEAIMPLLPLMVTLLKAVRNMVNAFNELPDSTQQIIITFTLLLAIIGPLGRYIGSLQILIALLGHAFHGLLVAGLKVAGFLIGWPGLIIAAIAAVVIFRDEIVNGIIRAFNMLPEGIQNSLMTVVRMVKNFALTVYEWLSYLNPFARHSPSLVDNVTRGVSTILDQYSRLNGVKAVIGEAVRAHKAFLAATGAASRNIQMDEFKLQKADIVAVAPGAGPAVDSMVSSIFRMRGALEQVNAELIQQRNLVTSMQTAIEDEMRPMNDAIFENEMAQKRLRLEILKMEQQGGGSINDLKRKYAELSGMIEKMTGKREDLRLSGAGSEITGPIDAQIDALWQQRKALEGQSAPIDEARKKMEELQRQGEILTLERDIAFDPRLKALDEEKEKLGELEDAYSDIAAAIRDLESALTSMAGQASSHLSRVEAAKKALKDPAVGGAVERFREAGMGDFEVPTGSAPPGLGREGGLPEMQDYNKFLEDELQHALDSMGGFDIWGSLKTSFKSAWEWIKGKVEPYVKPVWDAITGFFEGKSIGDIFSGMFDGINTGGAGGALSGVFDGFKDAWEDLKDILSQVAPFFEMVWDNVYAVVAPVVKFIVENIIDAGKSLWGEIKNWGPLVGEVLSAIGNLAKIWWAMFSGLWTANIAILRGIWELFWPTLRNVVDAVWNVIIGVVRAGLEIIRGIITVFAGILNGEWERVWDGILTIVDGVWDAIYAVIRGAWDLIYGIVKGLVEGIVGFFQWLFDVLVGNSIIPDMVDAIIKVFNFLKDSVSAIWDALWKAISWVWNNVVKPLWNAIKWTIDTVLIPVFRFLQSVVEAVWNAIGNAIKWVWNNLIKPIWDAVRWYIDNQLIPAFHFFRDKGKAAFEAIGNGIKWVWENMIKPVWNGIKSFIELTLAPAFHWLAAKIGDAWGAIKRGTSSAWNGVLSILGNAVNTAIDIINRLIDGFNWVTDKLGIGITITRIQRVSWGTVGGGGGGGSGGSTSEGNFYNANGTDRIPQNPHKSGVGSGFVTNRVRAIVGEGNPLYPEYVIPTDPTYRNRAVGLAQMLAQDLGVNFMHPQYASGGVPLMAFGGLIDAVQGVGRTAMEGVKAVGGAIQENAGKAIFGPINSAAKAALNMVPVPLVREATQRLREMMYNWVVGADQGIPTAPEIPDLGMFTWPFLWSAVRNQFPGARLFSSFRPGSITATGNLSYHARGRAIDITPSMDIFNWIARNYPDSREVIYSPAGGRQIRNGRPHTYSGVVRSMHWDHVHWAMENGGVIPSLANGGIVLPRPGGTLVRLGEAGQAEAVQPLPRDFGNGTTMNFYGDLSFPNITDPADAETFIANLEALA